MFQTLRRLIATALNRPLSQRLFLLAALWTTLVLVIAGLVLFTLQRQAVERSFDERLGVYVKEIVADLAAPTDVQRRQIGELGEPRFDLPLSGWYWQVTRLDGERPVITGSRSLVGGQLGQLVETGPDDPSGIRRGYAIGPDDRRVRQFERLINAGEEGRYLVAVAAPADEISDDIRDFGIILAATFGLLMLALVATTFLQVRLGLAPLARLRASVVGVRVGSSSLVEGSYPPDLAPLALELNQLIDSNREILERARTHVGNLAHALKTPLTVLMNEASATPGPLSGKVIEQTAVMRDQVNYYLDRARAAAQSAALGSVTEPVPVVEALIRTFEKIYRDREINGAIAGDTVLRFRGERQDLEEMLGNLLDNAYKWAAERVQVTIRGGTDGQRQTLVFVVEDDGPGLPETSMTDVIKRGRRLDETKPGSGLGLSIVVDIAKLYGGVLSLQPRECGGLSARLELPAV